MHLSLPGNHIIKKLEISGILPNVKSRTELINKISQIKADTLNEKIKLLDLVGKSIHNIMN